LNLAVDKRQSGNLSAAIRWLKKAIALGDGSACFELAKIYEARPHGNKLAAEFFRQAVGSRYISESEREEAARKLSLMSNQNN